MADHRSFDDGLNFELLVPAATKMFADRWLSTKGKNEFSGQSLVGHGHPDSGFVRGAILQTLACATCDFGCGVCDVNLSQPSPVPVCDVTTRPGQSHTPFET